MSTLVLALAAILSLAPPELLSSGDGSHLWMVARREGRIMLLHAAAGMPAGSVRDASVIQGGPPIDLSNWGARADLLFPARSAILPRPHILTTAAEQHPTSGRWYSVPPDRLELLPALPEEGEIESFASLEEGPIVLFDGANRAWRLRRGAWEAVELPAALAGASGRRIERGAASPSILARTGEDGGWERWRLDEAGWKRTALRLAGTIELRPIGGPQSMVVAEGEARRLLYLPGDGPIEVARIESGDEAVWFRQGPKLLADTGQIEMRSVDPVRGEIGPPERLESARVDPAAWIHLPLIGAALVAILMLVLFVRSLRDPQAPRIPQGWAPLPIPRRLIALAVDLAPAIVAVKVVGGAPWSRVLMPPAFEFDTEAALPAFAVILVAVTLSTVCEAITSRSLGKLLVGGRVVSARPGTATAPALLQILSRNLFKAVVLQMPALGLFTLLDPQRQGIGEMVSATAVVIDRPAAVEPAPS